MTIQYWKKIVLIFLLSLPTAFSVGAISMLAFGAYFGIFVYAVLFFLLQRIISKFTCPQCQNRLYFWPVLFSHNNCGNCGGSLTLKVKLFGNNQPIN